MTILRWLRDHDPEWRLALRVTVAGAAALLVARALSLPHGFWAVITALIVVQSSVGGSLKAAVDRLAGTLAGALVGSAVALAVPHGSPGALCLALAAAILPLAFLAALRPTFRIAPVTAAIMLLPTGAADLDPLQSALFRVMEIGIGSLVALAVALVVLPSRAHAIVASAAARIALLNADLLAVLLDPEPGSARTGATALHARIRAALKRLESAAEEAGRERRSHLTDQPDPEPLVRSLYRLRHDLVIVGRAVAAPLPEALSVRMAPLVADVRRAAGDALAEIAAALAERRSPDPGAGLEAAIRAYAAEVEAIRSEGVLRTQPGAVVGRFWTLPFAFEQVRQDLDEIAVLAASWARQDRAGKAGAAPS